jgi:hypothetical protein
VTRTSGQRLSFRTTVVYDTYWHFAAERQRIFHRRLLDEQPYTSDPILLRHRFTNAYRAADRVSQFLIRHVIYAAQRYSSEDIFFRTLLFRVFNKIATWHELERLLGPITWESYRFAAYDAVLSRALSRGERIYSAAYIMPSRAGRLNSPRKHRNHLRMIEMMMAASLPLRLVNVSTAAMAFDLLRSFPMIGDFLGYQFLVDLNYGPLLTFSEMDFVVAGPGALCGIKKCFADTAGLSPTDIIRFVADVQSEEFARREIEFPSLWGRPLHLIDCQNLFCEVDKYARIAHPAFTPAGGRFRIKQLYKFNPEPLRVWFPPKWHINKRIPGSLLAHRHRRLHNGV